MSFMETGALDSHSFFVHRINSLLETRQGQFALATLSLIPAGVLLFLSKAFKRLPAVYSIGFLICGGLYVAGLLGMQIVSELMGTEYGRASAAYRVAAGLEETMETAGIIGFNVVATLYLRKLSPEARFTAH